MNNKRIFLRNKLELGQSYKHLLEDYIVIGCNLITRDNKPIYEVILKKTPTTTKEANSSRSKEAHRFNLGAFAPFILLLLCSCGIKLKGLESLEKTKVKVETDIPDNINTGPDLEKIMQICDERYGEKTPESEECIDDALNYYDFSFGPNFDSVYEYCERVYFTEQEQRLCEEELLQIYDFSNETGGTNV